MGFKSLEDSVAFQLTQAFKLEGYRLVQATPDASRDHKYRSQLYDALASAEANVDEGFHRRTAGEIVQFLSIARGSISEAKRRIQDGVHRGYFAEESIGPALALGSRAGGAIAAWQRSMVPFLKKSRQRRKPNAASEEP